MSRIGRKPIEIPDGVKVKIKAQSINVEGKLGSLDFNSPNKIKVKLNDNSVIIDRIEETKKCRELHGLTRALIQNMVIGVSEGFKKELELNGVGFTADASKVPFLLLNLGFSHPIYFQIPSGIKISTPKPTQIFIEGINKQQVGEVAAKIRSFRKPEPYKGKGIKYSDEIIRRKAGKSIGGQA